MRVTRSSKSLSKMDEATGLSSDGKILLSAMRLEFNQMKAEMTEIVNGKNKVISDLEKEVSQLKEELEDAEAYSRRDCAIFSGNAIPASCTNEDATKVFLKVAKDKLNLDLVTGDISTAHRLGPKPLGQGPDNRKIIVKFSRRDAKKVVATAAKAKRGGSTKLFMNDCLTANRRSIHYTLRKLWKLQNSAVLGCSTSNGNIFAYTKATTPNSRDIRHQINSKVKLAKFCLDFVKKPVDTFLEGWQK